MKTSLRYRLAQVARSRGYNFRSSENDAVQTMRKEIGSLSGGIQFSINIDRSGEWYAESVNLQGIITGGRDTKDIDAMLKDAIFTYYGVDPKHCDDSILKNSGDVSTVKQLVHVAA